MQRVTSNCLEGDNLERNGYKGYTCIVRKRTEELRRLSVIFREDKIYQIPSLIQSGSQEGMQTLDQDLQRLLSQGLIEREDALHIAEDREQFQKGIF